MLMEAASPLMGAHYGVKESCRAGFFAVSTAVYICISSMWISNSDFTKNDA